MKTLTSNMERIDLIKASDVSIANTAMDNFVVLPMVEVFVSVIKGT
jgi:hypothetical protein